ncbi:MAG: amylo-alpha-1,6-glucosidase [Gammaproteobacteria bacterium]
MTETDYILGRYDCGNFERASSYEWLITNGIGGFACGTVSEAHSRRYHGLLTAAVTPPTGRMLLVSKLDVSVSYLNRQYDLFSNEYADGAVDPKGYVYLESFRLERGLPVWRYAVADALLEKRIAMQPGHNTTLVNLTVLRASASLAVTLTPLCTYRDYHHHRRDDWSPAVAETGHGFEIEAAPGAYRYRIECTGAEVRPDFCWHRQFKHRLETERGLDDTEDLFRPGRFTLTMNEGEHADIVIDGGDALPLITFETVLQTVYAGQKRLLQHLPGHAPDWIRQLALAAGQFVVSGHRRGDAQGNTIIAGYPWFTDWGRDTMIALPGLTLALGDLDTAADILRTFAGHVSRGMLPNRFPDQAADPDYNTVDATLWFFQAVANFTQYSRDDALARELYPVLADIIDWHRRGTRFGIRVDTEDGLLTAGEEGMQLTWMDAKVDRWVVTPRIGKCVEINALWYNALMDMAGLAERFGYEEQAAGYTGDALRVKAAFRRFWNAEKQCLYDVVDGPEGRLSADGLRGDDRIRPNQLFAVSLPHSPLNANECKAVVDICARELLTSFGLRSLAEGEPGYVARYRGDVLRRDGAYHQGTVWAWLIGPFVEAHYRVYRDTEEALSFLEPFRLHLASDCLGQVSEIFDADPPHPARGCFAQAWSVGEILRVWLQLNRSSDPLSIKRRTLLISRARRSRERSGQSRHVVKLR